MCYNSCLKLSTRIKVLRLANFSSLYTSISKRDDKGAGLVSVRAYVAVADKDSGSSNCVRLTELKKASRFAS